VLANIFMILFLLSAVILSLLVLIQRGRGGGLAGAFGGAGGSSAFGTKTADVFIKATAVVGGLFFLLAIIASYCMRSGGSAAAPATIETPAPASGDATPGAGPTPGGATGGGAAPAPGGSPTTPGSGGGTPSPTQP
jgi:preprotein translocase subunit SecG